MTQTANRPVTISYFEIKFGDVTGVFTECTGLTSEIEVVEHKGSGEKGVLVIHKVPGRVTWSNITLRRGMTTSKTFFDWYKKAMEGDSSMRRSGSIILHDSSKKVTSTWDVLQAWPCKFNGPDLHAGNNSLAVEELVIAHEGLTRK